MVRLLSAAASLTSSIVRPTQVIRLFAVVALAVVFVLSGGARPGAWVALAFLFLAFVFVAVALSVEMIRGIL